MNCIRCLWTHAFTILLAVLVVSVPARGQDTHWQGSIGSWFDPANWYPGVPTSTDNAYLLAGGEAQIASGTAVADALLLSSHYDPFDEGGSAVVSSIFLTGEGQLEARREMIGVYGGSGRFVQVGCANTVGGRLSLGVTRWAGSRGVYELRGGGQLSAGAMSVGHDGYGYFLQTSGDVEVLSDLRVALFAGSEGTYNLQGGGLVSGETYMGALGNGWFTHTGGSHTAQDGLYLGGSQHVRGTYQLSGDANLTAGEEFIGYTDRNQSWDDGPGTGLFIQTGGTNTTEFVSVNSLSRYELSGGALQIPGGGLNLEGQLDCRSGSGAITAGDNSIVNLSNGITLGTENTSLSVGANSLTIYSPGAHPADVFGQFSTEGMLHEAGQTLVLQAGQGFAGRGRIDDYVVCAGQIAASPGGGIDVNGGITVLGPQASVNLGEGALTVDNTVSGLAGGSLAMANAYVGRDGPGEIIQSAGTLTTAMRFYLGFDHTGTYSQTGGTASIRILHIGYWNGSGSYTISGGTLSAEYLHVSWSGSGTLNIADPSAQITVSSGLSFGKAGALTAVPGSTIHMTRSTIDMSGSYFSNGSTDPVALGGLGNLTLIFEGGAEVMGSFEVAGQDMGASEAGFDLNFTLGTLQLGGADVGRIELVDRSDNQPGWEGDEALYAKNLIIQGVGSFIDIDELNLYYLNGGDPKQLFYGDCNLDGRVDITDLSALGANWSTLSPGDKEWSEGDTNGDMLIDIVDLTALAANWGAQTIVIPGGAVPEPTALVLLGLGGLIVLTRRRGARR